jgi:predicted NAD/FAD-dependent oxidoreductase
MSARRSPTARAVAVIGAGIAGGTCAQALADRGYAVTVFDKGRGPGGQAGTRREASWQFDHGAQYLTVRDARFGKRVADWIARGVVAPWEARFVTLRGGVAYPSPSRDERYVGLPGMSALVADLLTGCDVHRATEVAAVKRDGDAWQLTTTDGEDLGRFDAVAVATHPRQAATLLAAVPELARRAAAAEMLPSVAVLAALPYRLETTFDAAFVEDAPLRWVARNSSKPGRDRSRETWVLHASPEWSARHVERSRDELAALLLEDFFRVTGLRPVAPEHALAHRWRAARPAVHQPPHSLHRADLGIGACGDWLADGRVEGAYLSGTHLAARLLPEERTPPNTERR